MTEDKNNEQREEETVIDEQVEDSTDENVEILDGDTEVEETESDDPKEAEITELRNKLLRHQADYDNFRRRTRQEKEADAKYRSQRLIESVLPVMDNFSRALKHEAETEEGQNIHKGMAMVYDQLVEALKSEGLEEIPTEGEAFDPNVHQAVMQVEEEGFESNQIVEELQKGYLLKDRVVRPAMVKVNA
ncbi:protein GrpE [Bacillaceae bacterium JMAK1]|nr:protein GrpE [Bacillaceae bacterium JMAK1]